MSRLWNISRGKSLTLITKSRMGALFFHPILESCTAEWVPRTALDRGLFCTFGTKNLAQPRNRINSRPLDFLNFVHNPLRGLLYHSLASVVDFIQLVMKIDKRIGRAYDKLPNSSCDL